MLAFPAGMVVVGLSLAIALAAPALIWVAGRWAWGFM